MKLISSSNRYRLIYIFAFILLLIVCVAVLYDPYRGVLTKTDICSQNQLFIARAISQYEREYGQYPPPYTVNDDGTPLHSWRVLILPYLEQKELYDRIRLEEPWDSEYNSQFHNCDLPIFHCPSKMSGKVGGCDYAVLVGNSTTLFPPPERKELIVTSDQKPNILVVESAEPISCWMEPRDIRIDLSQNNTINKIGIWHYGKTIVTLTDCSVIKVTPDELAVLLQRLCTCPRPLSEPTESITESKNENIEQKPRTNTAEDAPAGP